MTDAYDQPGDDWIQTFTGRQFFPLRPRVEDVAIEDIAHALALKCRYSGHTIRHYSVARHSSLIATALWLRRLGPRMALAGLLHDAAEAYLPDVARPVKPFMTGFAAIESRIEAVIAAKYDLPWPWPIPEVKAADTAILRDEMEQVMAAAPLPWNLPPGRLNVIIGNTTWRDDEREFLDLFETFSVMIRRDAMSEAAP